MKELKINVPDGYEIDKDKSTFEKIVFKKKNELPKSWENLENIKGYWVSYNCKIEIAIGNNLPENRNVFRAKEQAEASLAFAQLSQLRDVYRQGWEPDWGCRETLKHCIIFYNNELYIDDFYTYHEFLSFQDEETAYLFLENFRDLIEQAKPLMS